MEVFQKKKKKKKKDRKDNLAEVDKTIVPINSNSREVVSYIERKYFSNGVSENYRGFWKMQRRDKE